MPFRRVIYRQEHSLSVSEHELESLASDYQALTGSRFSHFHCPILLCDEDVELCDGHVIGRKFASSSRKTVIQRADVDSFYGRCFESRLYDFARTRQKGLVEHLNDSNLSRRVPLRVERDGQPLPHYPVSKHSNPSDHLVQINDASGNAAKIGLKLGDQDGVSLEGRHLQIVREGSFVTEAIASVLKAAHLTMFSIFGYRHVFSLGGSMLANILGDCFRACNGLKDSDVRERAGDFFEPHKNIARPLYVYNKELLSGSIDDHTFVVCVGSSGIPYAIGVLVRMADLMSVVFLPSDDARRCEMYDSLIKGDLETIRCHPATFIQDATGKKWQVQRSCTIELQYSDDASAWTKTKLD